MQPFGCTVFHPCHVFSQTLTGTFSLWPRVCSCVYLSCLLMIVCWNYVNFGDIKLCRCSVCNVHWMLTIQINTVVGVPIISDIPIVGVDIIVVFVSCNIISCTSHIGALHGTIGSGSAWVVGTAALLTGREGKPLEGRVAVVHFGCCVLSCCVVGNIVELYTKSVLFGRYRSVFRYLPYRYQRKTWSVSKYWREPLFSSKGGEWPPFFSKGEQWSPFWGAQPPFVEKGGNSTKKGGTIPVENTKYWVNLILYVWSQLTIPKLGEHKISQAPLEQWPYLLILSHTSLGELWDRVKNGVYCMGRSWDMLPQFGGGVNKGVEVTLLK